MNQKEYLMKEEQKASTIEEPRLTNIKYCHIPNVGTLYEITTYVYYDSITNSFRMASMEDFRKINWDWKKEPPEEAEYILRRIFEDLLKRG